MSLIVLDEISFSYAENEPQVITKLSLSVEKGQCLLVEGDNGTGKSTLFRIINGLSFPHQGSYYLDGNKITKAYLDNNANSKLFHKRIGYLFQNPDVMLFNGNVYDEVAFGPRQMGKDEGQVGQIVKDCLDVFGLDSLKEKAPYHLSGGQKKKVALASVLALNPDILVLDEPLAGLDRGSQEMLIGLLKELKNAGKTLVIATHEERLKETLADKLLKLG